MIENTALNASVATGTTGVGISGMVGWIHSEIAVIAAVVGIVASSMIILCQAFNINKMRIETRILLEKEAEMRRTCFKDQEDDE
ncbi:MAG: hypothetical protein KJP07_13655 [Desulfatitalea sp.]|nr:hypothetical protein [Desulfatitalea sp.]